MTQTKECCKKAMKKVFDEIEKEIWNNRELLGVNTEDYVNKLREIKKRQLR